MEPPLFSAGALPAPQPARPGAVKPPSSIAPYLAIRSHADRRLVLGALAGGAAFDIAAHSGLATIVATAWVVVAVGAILLARRTRGRVSRLLLGAAPVPGIILTVSASPWVIAPAVFAVAVLLVLGVSAGADGSGPGTTFPALGTRAAIVLGHVACAPEIFRFGADPGHGAAARRWAAASARGALLGAPVLLTVGLLLAFADPIFRSWFDLTAALQHLLLVCAGAWFVAGLARAASAARPSAALPPAPPLGTVEAALVLGGLCALYSAFVAAQFVALSGGGRHVLVTHGLTYAEYARSGFFQLLACAAITLLVLLGLRACANPDHPVLMGLSGLTVALTVGVVIVAVRRLQFYEAAFGLTMLRLACLVAAVWIGVVFVLLGATIHRQGLARRHFPAAVLISGLIIVGIWGVSNPASIVAHTNLSRAGNGHSLDINQAASLGPDAVPTLVADLGSLGGSDAAALRHAICARSPGRYAGTAFNLSRARAHDALARACGSPGS
jgi:Domain of unknown function (DUF4153)